MVVSYFHIFGDFVTWLAPVATILLQETCFSFLLFSVLFTKHVNG